MNKVTVAFGHTPECRYADLRVGECFMWAGNEVVWMKQEKDEDEEIAIDLADGVSGSFLCTNIVRRVTIEVKATV